MIDLATIPAPTEEDPADMEQPRGPQRRCVVSGVVCPKEKLLRFVVDPQGVIVFDLSQRLPGRGIWLSASQDVVNTAVGKRVFARAARKAVRVPEDLGSQIPTALRGHCLNFIALARRAGQAVCGFEKVRSAIRDGSAGVLLAASDGAADGREKITALAPALPLLNGFSAAELGQVFGRDATVHAAILSGGFVSRIRHSAALLRGFTTM